MPNLEDLFGQKVNGVSLFKEFSHNLADEIRDSTQEHEGLLHKKKKWRGHGTENPFKNCSKAEWSRSNSLRRPMKVTE